MTENPMKGLLATIFATALLSSTVLAQEGMPNKDDLLKQPVPYSPYVDQHFPKRVLFGDTHHHTILSFDDGLFGTKLGPDDSYRFAKGEEVISNTGLRAKLNRPLDFLVVSDHAEYLGIADLILSADPGLLANPYGKRWYDMFKSGSEGGFDAAKEVFGSITEGTELWKDDKMKRTVWERVTSIATKHNDPGRFTAFNGYEWTSAPGPGNNLHRVVIFRDGSDRVNQIVPFSAFDSPDPEDLWKFLDSYEVKTGGNVLAIPHNGNASNGLMFDDETMSGKKLSKA
jgi:hypothetical protein